ncbi:hypothetical protein CC80DRAFT_538548 [Byssothecium circinans]|uniref:Beta-xylosidase C-terminal Concanavalin A-like domain-containing protein n=1 Tax=Byssothecium circinans TaxID=147558 RepID=A0A6A5THF3_9PLEO|nr:hypothetical protein CC80DRAFT_538548 [Byssothecium circinans]
MVLGLLIGFLLCFEEQAQAVLGENGGSYLQHMSSRPVDSWNSRHRDRIHHRHGALLARPSHPVYPSANRRRESLVARRQTHFSYDAETVIDFNPIDERQFAGLVAYYCRYNFFYLTVTAHADGKRELLIFSSEASWPEGRFKFPLAEPVSIPQEGKVRLALNIRGRGLQFFYALEGEEELKKIGPVYDASILSDECGGHQAHGSFTGAFVGVAASDLDGLESTAEFDYFVYRPVRAGKSELLGVGQPNLLDDHLHAFGLLRRRGAELIGEQLGGKTAQTSSYLPPPQVHTRKLSSRMSNVPTRRLSTGGLPPVKTREQYVVEDAPNHNSTPCFTAWAREEIVEIPEGWSSSDFPISHKRPQWSFQIYDTTPQSDNPEHLKTLAETLHKETREEREAHGRAQPDRIDVWGMPLATDVSDEERIAKCKAHVLAEIASRNTAGNSDFHIPQLNAHDQWQRVILIIDRPQELWNEDEGGFLAVYWDVHPSYLELLAREYGNDHQEPETSAFRYTRTELGQLLANLRDAL